MSSSLASLKARFASVQSEKRASNFLSEHVCIGILLKLQERKNVELIASSDGSEFVTFERLKTEVLDVLKQAIPPGRINLADLPVLLGFGAEHLEAAAEAVVKESNGVLLVNGELISNVYLFCIADEIDDAVQKVGRISLAELSQKYILSAAFLKGLVQNNLGDTIQGSLKGQHLYTRAYLDRVMCSVRGILRGVVVPVSIPELCALHELDEDLADKAIQSLLRDFPSYGKFQSHCFIPRVYEKAINDAAISFYRSNQYVSRAMLKKGSKTETAIIGEIDNTAIPLTNSWMSPHLLIPLRVAIIEDITSTGGFMELSSYFPFTLASSDIMTVLHHLNAGVVLSKSMEEQLQQTAGKKSVVATQKQTIAILHTEDADLMTQPLFVVEVALVEKALQCSLSFVDQLASQHEEKPAEVVSSAKAKKGTKKNRPSASEAEDSTPMSIVALHKNLFLDYLAAHKDTQHCAADLLSALVDMHKEALQLRFTQEMHKKKKEVGSLCLQNSETLQDSLSGLYDDLCLSWKTMQSLAITCDSAIYVYLCKAPATALLDGILKCLIRTYRGEDVQVTAQNRWKEIEVVTTAMEKEQKKGSSHSSSTTKSIRDMAESISEKKRIAEGAFDSFLALAPEVSKDCHVLLRPLDKKREKILLKEKHVEWLRLVKISSTQEAIIRMSKLELYCCCLRLLQESNQGSFLLFPPDAWAVTFVLKRLLAEPSLRADAAVRSTLQNIAEDEEDVDFSVHLEGAKKLSEKLNSKKEIEE